MFTNKYIDLALGVFTLFCLLFFGLTDAPINSMLFFTWGIYTLTSSISDYYTKNKLEQLRDIFYKNVHVINSDNKKGDDDEIA